jgi:hypothetical protein
MLYHNACCHLEVTPGTEQCLCSLPGALLCGTLYHGERGKTHELSAIMAYAKKLTRQDTLHNQVLYPAIASLLIPNTSSDLQHLVRTGRTS